jgi:hypothetical protein
MGPDVDTDWLITNLNSGSTSTMSFANVENLTGGTGVDVFTLGTDTTGTTVVTGQLSGTIDGGATPVGTTSQDTLTAADIANEWTVDGADSGSIGTGTTVTSFRRIANLVGGSADDTFSIRAGGSVSGTISGGADDADADTPAVDTLTYELFGSPVTFTLTSGAFALSDLFSASTAAADPGAGRVAMNGTDPNAVTELFLSTADTTGADATASITRAEGTTGGQIRLSGTSDPSSWLLFRLLGMLVPAGGTYAIANVELISAGSGAPFAAGDTVVVSYLPPAPFATAVGALADIDVVTGSASSDTIRGPPADVVQWTVDGTNEGTVAGVSFSSFENLLGSADNADVFSVSKGATVSGIIDGGSGGTDSLLLFTSDTDAAVYNVAGTDVAGTTHLAGTVAVAFAGLDHLDVISGNDSTRYISGTDFADTMTFASNGATSMKVTLAHVAWYDPAAGVITSSLTFANPLTALVIEGRAGADTIVIQSLSPGWHSGASLYVYGNRRLSETVPIFVDDDLADTVSFTGDIDTKDGTLEAYAAHISVAPGITINAGEGWITFRARQIGLATVENLSPVYVTDRNVSITVGAGAVIAATGIYLIAQAEDRSLSEYLSVPKEVANFVIDPLTDKIGSALALPVKVLVRNSTATITIGDGAHLVGADTVGIYATASADAGGTAHGSLFSVGYAQATATATVTIGTNVLITSTAAIVITSSAEASASLSASTSRSLEGIRTPGGAQFALSVAVSNAVATSHVTVGHGTRIEADKTVNIQATGGVESEAEAEAGLFADGTAGLAYGNQL